MSDMTEELARLLLQLKSLPPMTEEEQREQRASFTFGQIALMSEWANKSETELEGLKDLCRRLAGCLPNDAKGENSK